MHITYTRKVEVVTVVVYVVRKWGEARSRLLRTVHSWPGCPPSSLLMLLPYRLGSAADFW